jgi:hypothetical protein
MPFENKKSPGNQVKAEKWIQRWNKYCRKANKESKILDSEEWPVHTKAWQGTPEARKWLFLYRASVTCYGLLQKMLSFKCLSINTVSDVTGPPAKEVGKAARNGAE